MRLAGARSAAGIAVLMFMLLEMVCAWPSRAEHVDLSPFIDQAQALFFQMGHDGSDFLPGAIPVTVNSLYRPYTTYGWIHAGSRGTGGQNLAAYVRSGDVAPAPDSITGNCISWRGGDMPLFFRVGVPDGEYRIWIYSGLFGLSYFYDTLPFQISAQGDEVFSYDPRRGFRERFFEELDDSYEYTPDWTAETIWEKYIQRQGAAVFALRGRATDGQLTIRFDMPQPEEPKDARLAINAIVICPVALEPEGRKLLEQIDVVRRQQYKDHVTLVKGEYGELSGSIADQFQSVGFVPFVRNFMDPVFAESIPRQDEVGKPIRLSAAQGQREIASFALHPIRDMEQVSVNVSPLHDGRGNTISGDSLTLHWVRYMIQPLDYRHRTAEYRGVPLLMREYKPLDYRQGMNRQYILAVSVPQDAAPGLYRGQVSVTPQGEAPYLWDLELEVYPFCLETYDDDDERIWLYYGDMSYKRYGELLMSEEERWELVDRDLAYMKQQAMAPTILFDWFPDDADLDRFMELYMKHGFRGFATFGDYSMLRMVDGYFSGGNKALPDSEPYIEQIRHVLQRKEEKGWPDIAFYTFAEMKSGMPGYLEAKRIMTEIKEEVPEAVLIALTNPVSEAEFMITTPADIIGPNAVSMTQEVTRKIAEADKKLWFYAWGRQRFRCGYVDWRLRNRGAVREWYSYTSRAPFNPLDGSRHDSWNDSPPLIGPDGPVSTLGMEEVTQGRIDFFYLATLELWLERAKARATDSSHTALLRAQALIDELESRIRPDYSYYYTRVKETNYQRDQFAADYEEAFDWDNDEFDQYRRLIAQAIMALKEACLDHPSIESTTSMPVRASGSGESAEDAGRERSATRRDLERTLVQWAPDGRKISYVSQNNGVGRISILDLATGVERRLPVEVARESHYSWSPSADYVACTATDGRDSMVAVVSADGTQMTRIGSGKNPRFSPDGQRLAYVTDADIMVYDLASGQTTNITRQQVPGVMERLAWSPDGETVYYSKDGALWRVDADGGNNKRLIGRNQTGISPYPAIENPVPSPDGTRVYISLNLEGLYAGVSENQIAVCELSSRSVQRITDADSWALSPDGSTLVWNQGEWLVAYDVSSGTRRQLVKGRNPHFSPTGDRVVYLYRESLSEEFEIRIVDLSP